MSVMYDLFTGSYERVMYKIVFYKRKNKFVPCLVTNYYFKPKLYTLVPADDLSLSPDKRRVYRTTKIYIPFGLNIY
jgi:hypothetical protein